MAAKVLARYKQKENATPYPLFTPVDNAFYYYDKMVTALVGAAERAAKEMLVQDKATRRIDVQRSLMETAEGIKTSYDQYELEFQEGGFPDGVRGVGGHHCGGPYIRLHPGRRQLSLLREAYAAKHACNMGGIVLISNAGLMWATCAFIPVLLTFCFPLAAMLEAYVCEPYDEQDGTSLDGNGLWLSLVCCLLSMLAAIPVTLMISRYFLRMHRYMVDGQAPDDECGSRRSGSQDEAGKASQGDILQQSREARCLVMSFDTLEAPPALPAVSVDSGSHDLARIIPPL
ncbi:hypothetical protein HPB52_024623 [Rhipicephalus sanguineus]|uniref:Uncharacterized protein n=1 Tax=Rhipicephalus sanguineus TaxID=34632 RepID=A0A9D4TE48_RHISA|nr:hypothetical protein HPB52_024623 [Rhipicephalus sanguineus]